MPVSPKTRELVSLVRAQSKHVARQSRILVQLSARLDESMAEDTNDSPKEGTHDNRSKHQEA